MRRRTRHSPGGLFALLVSVILLMTAVSRCHDADRYVLTSDESVPVSSLLLLTVQGDSILPADGFSTTKLNAFVADVSEGVRSVLFTTTAGSLLVGGKTIGGTAEVPADESGNASIELKSPREPAEATVLVSITDVNPQLVQQTKIVFRSVILEDIIDFVDLVDTAKAGGSEATTVTVRISPSLRGEDRRVTFSTSLGTFEFATAQGGQQREVLAGEDNVASVILLSPDEAGEALISATVRGFVNETTLRFLTETTVTFTEAPTTAPADGFTLTPFEVTIESALRPNESRTVVFQTTAGTLITGSQEARSVSVVADIRDVASVFLRSPKQVVVAVITASLSGASDERAIRFNLVGPDSIFVTIEPDKFRLTPNDQTLVQAFLVRDPGRGEVTEGLDIAFSATDSIGNPVPLTRFFNVTPVDSNGVATAIFTPDGSGFRGLVNVIATWSDGETSVVGVTNLRLVDEVSGP